MAIATALYLTFCSHFSVHTLPVAGLAEVDGHVERLKGYEMLRIQIRLGFSKILHVSIIQDLRHFSNVFENSSRILVP